MATIDELVVSIGADVTDLRAGLADSIEQTRQFGAEVERSMGTSGAVFGNLEGPLLRATAQLRAMREAAQAVDLADPAAVTTLRELIAAQLELARAAGVTADELSLADAALGRLDGHELEGVSGRATTATRTVRDLNTEVRTATTSLRALAQGADVRSPIDVANVREAVRAQREYLLSIEATIPQLSALAQVSGQFEARVTSAARAEAQAQRALGAELAADYSRRVALQTRMLSLEEQALAIDARRTRELERQSAATLRAAESAGVLASAVQRTDTAASRGNFSALSTTAERWGPIGQRAANTAIAVGFGLEALARGGASGEGGLRTATRAAASFAALFGTPGLIVSGVLATGLAITEMFDHARDDMAKTEAAFLQSLEQMRRGVNVQAVGQVLGELMGGTTRLDEQGNVVRERGIAQLRQQRTELELNLAANERNLRAVEATARAEAIRNAEALREATGQVTPPAPIANAPAVVEARTQVERTNAAIQATNALLETQEARFRAVEQVARGVTAQADATRRYNEQQSSGARAHRDADREAAAALREANQERERQIASVQKAVEAMQGTTLAIRGSLVVGQNPGEELRRGIRQLVDSFDSAAPENAVLLRARLETTRDELFRLIRDQLALDDNPFALTIRADLSASLQASSAQFGEFLHREFQNTTPEEFAASAILADDFARAASLAQQIDSDLSGLPDYARDFVHALAQGVQSVANLGTGLENLSRGGGFMNQLGDLSQSIGGIVGVVGAVASLGDALFSQTEGQRENTEILRRNTAALRDATLAASGFNPESASAINNLARPFTTDADFARLRAGVIENRGTGDREVLEKFLAPFNVSLEQAEAQAREFGLTLYDSKGRIDPRQLDVFRDRLRVASDELLRFRDSVDEQRTRQGILRDLQDVDSDPVRQFQDELDLVGHFGATIGDRFRDLDVSSAEGLAEAKRRLVDLFESFGAVGGLTADDLGRLSKEDFLDFIKAADDSLDSLATTADDLARSMTDLGAVAGFNVTALRIRAADAVDPFAIATAAAGAAATLSRTPLTLEPTRRLPDDIARRGAEAAAPAPTVVYIEQLVSPATSVDALTNDILRRVGTFGKAAGGDAGEIAIKLGRLARVA